MPRIDDSILQDVKQMIGQEWDDSTFDVDIMIHINGVWLELEQLGVGPALGYSITGAMETWESFIPKSNLLNAIKSFMYLKVRLIFDPPQTGPLTKAIEDQLARLEFRINVEAERPLPVVEVAAPFVFQPAFVGESNTPIVEDDQIVFPSTFAGG